MHKEIRKDHCVRCLNLAFSLLGRADDVEPLLKYPSVITYKLLNESPPVKLEQSESAFMSM